MNTSIIREKLHQFIDAIEDKKAEAIYTLLADQMDADAQRKRLINAERENYLSGTGKSYSTDEVREMAINKDRRHAI